MQRYEESAQLSELQANPDISTVEDSEETNYCSTTSRIVIISPFPASLHPLVRELTARCYDVLLFHHEDDPILAVLQGDLLLIDRSKGPEGTPSLLHAPMPLLTLISGNAEKNANDEASIVWPCPIEEVLIKIQDSAAPINRSTPDILGQIRHKDIEVDLKRMTVYHAGQRIDLTKTEFDLLKVLLNSDGRVLSRQEMMDIVWGDQYFGGSNSIDVHIKSLRQKLRDDPKQPKYITTVRGVGYRLTD